LLGYQDQIRRAEGGVRGIRERTTKKDQKKRRRIEGGDGTLNPSSYEVSYKGLGPYMMGSPVLGKSGWG